MKMKRSKLCIIHEALSLLVCTEAVAVIEADLGGLLSSVAVITSSYSGCTVKFSVVCSVTNPVVLSIANSLLASTEKTTTTKKKKKTEITYINLSYDVNVI